LGFDNIKYRNDLQRAAFHHHHQKRREEIVRELEQLADKRSPMPKMNDPVQEVTTGEAAKNVFDPRLVENMNEDASNDN